MKFDFRYSESFRRKKEREIRNREGTGKFIFMVKVEKWRISLAPPQV